jgi:hypothetical protein
MHDVAKIWPNVTWWRQRPGHWTAVVPRHMTQTVIDKVIDHVDGLCTSVSYWTLHQDADDATIVVDVYGNDGVPIKVLDVFDLYECQLGIDADGLMSNRIENELAEKLVARLRRLDIDAYCTDGAVRIRPSVIR